MGTLSNGFIYTDTYNVGTKSKNRFQFVITQYYNVTTNQSCLAITVNFRSGSVGSYNNNCKLKSKTDNDCGVYCDGIALTNASGGTVVRPDGSYGRYRVAESTDGTYRTITVGGSATSFPWYSKPFSHNEDGTKTVVLKGFWNCNYDYQTYTWDIERHEYVYTTHTASKGFDTETLSVELKTIPRASTFEVANTTVGNAVKGVLTIANPAFTHLITAEYEDGFTEDIDTSNLMFNPNSQHSYASMGESDTYTTVLFNVETYSDDTLIGTSTNSCKVYAAKVAPTVTITGTILNPQLSLTGTEKIIHNYTNITLSVSATGANGASIETYSISADGVSYSSGETKTYNAVNSHTFYAKVKDSRGVEGTATLTYDYVDYAKPTISVTSTKPNPSTGATSVTARGTAKSVNFGSVSNSITVQIRYQDIESGTYSSWVNGSTSGLASFTSTYNYTLDYQKAYYIFAKVTDKLNTITTAGFYVNNKPILYWTENKVVVNNATEANSLTANTLNVNSNSIFNGAVNINDGVSIKNDASSPNINFYTNIDNSLYGIVREIIENNKTNFRFDEYSIGSNGSRTDYVETYSLPTANNDLTESKYYNILTTKSAVTLAQGGTGATTADGALTNLGLNKPVKIADNWGLNTSITFADVAKYKLFIGLGVSYYTWVGIKNAADTAIIFHSVNNTSEYSYVTFQAVTISGTTLKTPSSCNTFRNGSKQTNDKVLGEVWAIC